MLQPRNEEKMSLTFCLRLVVHKWKLLFWIIYFKKKKKKNANQGYMGCEFRSLIWRQETLMVKQKPIIHFEIWLLFSLCVEGLLCFDL